MNRIYTTLYITVRLFVFTHVISGSNVANTRMTAMLKSSYPSLLLVLLITYILSRANWLLILQKSCGKITLLTYPIYSCKVNPNMALHCNW